MTVIATWNVNSVKARLPRVVEWLETFSPDVALLQELKTEDAGFPRLEIESAGYHVETVGQKTYNGVAILSKQPITVIHRALPGDASDEQARYLEADTFGIRVASIYLPNGNPIGTEKFDYKLAWMARLRARAAELKASGGPVALMGDFNVIPTPEDCYDPAAWAGAWAGPPWRRSW